jgi:hypothetical protein
MEQPTNEQLQMVAERLGPLWTPRDGAAMEPFFEVSDGTFCRPASNGDLLLAILQRAAQIPAWPKTGWCPATSARDDRAFWWAQFWMPDVGQVESMSQESLIEAAITAFIQLPVTAK